MNTFIAGHRFNVYLDSQELGGVRKITGLKRSVDVVEHAQAAPNDAKLKEPTHIRHAAVTV